MLTPNRTAVVHEDKGAVGVSNVDVVDDKANGARVAKFGDLGGDALGDAVAKHLALSWYVAIVCALLEDVP
eukprot:1553949-Pleurochrysis_carterae.AAC.1